MPFLPTYIGNGLPVIIAELLPPFRTVILGGRDRPEQGPKIGTRQRAKKTYYPGSSAASTQVLGTEDDPITLTGWFQDPLTLIDGGPAARIGLLRGMMQGQARCQLAWGNAILRWGRVSRCDFFPYQANRWRYEIEFDVDQANEPIAIVPLPIIASTVADFANQARAALDAVEAAVGAASAVKSIGGVVT